jgi:ketosteroid isomerase-like protein
MKITITFLTFLLLLITAGCSQSRPAKSENAPPKAEPAKPAVNRPEEEKAVREADIAWAAAAAKKDVDATAAFMTDDGATLAPNAPIAKGMDAVKKTWAGMLGLKDMAISWQPTTIEVAESGEMAYALGTYQLSFTDPTAGKVEDKGKYLEVWKKVGGKWKCHLDMFNSDIAAK